MPIRATVVSRRTTSRLLLCLAGLSLAGCIGFRRGRELEVFPTGPALSREGWGLKRIWIRGFEHTAVVGLDTAYASRGGSASRVALARGRFTKPPLYLVRAVEDAALFKGVAPTIETGGNPDLILEGTVSTRVHTPWWTWLQVIDLWLHALIFPTLGSDWETVGEVSLYDAENVLLHRWRFRESDRYLGTLWWGLGHGGSNDQGFDVERQQEAIRETVERIKSGPAPPGSPGAAPAR